MKMWSGRFREPLDPEFDHWQRSFEFDCRLLGEELAASKAWARALHRVGVLTPQELEAILGGLGEIERRAGNDPQQLEGSDAEDVHHYVELELAKLIGETAYKLHTGRSRNEQIATDLRLYARRVIDSVRANLVEFLSRLLERAGELDTTAMPAYTHLQRAEPVLAAHWLLAYVEMFLRDADRLAECRKRVNICPLGSGAVAGSGIKLDRDAMTRELGFDGISANSMDATSDRDFEVELLWGLSLIAIHLSRLAEEITIFSTVEFGFVALSDRYSTGSSAMPQKKNPDALELLRGKAAGATARALAAAMTLKGLPLAYNKDMQELQLPLFESVETITASLKIAAGLMAEIEFKTERMNASAHSGFLNATEAANYLVRRGVPFRRAHEAVGHAVRRCLELGCELESLPREELVKIRPEFGPDFYDSLTVPAVLAAHDVAGGTAPAQVREALAAAQQRVRALVEEESHAYA